MRKTNIVIPNSVTCTIALALTISLSSVAYGKSKSKLTYPQVATGQEILYDADGAVVDKITPSDPLYGQDANYKAGAKMSYKNNGDGTITDLNTGLMWQMIPIKEGFNWQGAKEYCENLELAGYDDWRIPSAKELYSISDFGTGWPYINTEYFELIDTERVGKDEQYWTSHLYVGSIGEAGSSTAFGVNHGTGHIKAYGAGISTGQGGEQRPPQQQGRQGQGGRQQMGQDQQRPPRDSSQMAEGQRPQMGQGQRPPRDSSQMAEGQRPQMGQGQRPPRDSSQMAEGGRPQMALGERPQQGQGQMAQGGRPQQGGQQQGAPQQGSQSRGNRGQKYVRAVRGEAYGINKFVDNGNGTVTDEATGLMWSQADSKEGMNWIEALKYAEGSELAGYSDWRLPNVKELQGILSYDYAPGSTDPAKDRAAIDPIFSCSEIINENGDKDCPYFWSGTSALFQRGRPYYYAWYVAFGRGVDPNGLDHHGAGAVRFDTKHENGPAGEDKARFFNYVRLVRNTK